MGERLEKGARSEEAIRGKSTPTLARNPSSPLMMMQQPVGAFFSQVGQLHEVHHIWQYPYAHGTSTTSTEFRR